MTRQKGLEATKRYQLRKKVFNPFKRSHDKLVVNYQPKPKVLLFEETRKIVGLRNVKEYKELCKQGKLPKGLPALMKYTQRGE